MCSTSSRYSSTKVYKGNNGKNTQNSQKIFYYIASDIVIGYSSSLLWLKTVYSSKIICLSVKLQKTRCKNCSYQFTSLSHKYLFKHGASTQIKEEMKNPAFYFLLVDEISVDWLMLVSFLFILCWEKKNNFCQEQFSMFDDIAVRKKLTIKIFFSSSLT